MMTSGLALESLGKKKEASEVDGKEADRMRITHALLALPRSESDVARPEVDATLRKWLRSVNLKGGLRERTHCWVLLVPATWRVEGGVTFEIADSGEAAEARVLRLSKGSALVCVTSAVLSDRREGIALVPSSSPSSSTAWACSKRAKRSA